MFLCLCGIALLFLSIFVEKGIIDCSLLEVKLLLTFHIYSSTSFLEFHQVLPSFCGVTMLYNIAKCGADCKDNPSTLFQLWWVGAVHVMIRVQFLRSYRKKGISCESPISGVDDL